MGSSFNFSWRISGFKLAQIYGPRNSLFHFHNAPLRFSVPWHSFRVFLSTFSVLVTLKHFHDGLRKQGRKIVKRAFHFCDRGKNAWLYQIFEYKVNTFISNFFSWDFLLQMFLICPNFLLFPTMKDVPAVKWQRLPTFTLFWRVLIVLPLRVSYKLIKLSLFEQVTAVEFTKIRKQCLAFTLDKISNSGELQRISKLSIWFSASPFDRNTFSFVCVSCGACTQSCLALAFMSGLCTY